MKSFKLEATKTTFGLDFDSEKGVLHFMGNSYPTNAMEFFKQPVAWLKEYLNTPRELTIKVYFSVQYFNTSSSKYIFNMLELLDNYYNAHGNIDIVWYFDEDDEDIYESWKNLILQLNVPYRIVNVSEDKGDL